MSQTAHETVDRLALDGERVGLIKVRLYRPFSVQHLARALPPGEEREARLLELEDPTQGVFTLADGSRARKFFHYTLDPDRGAYVDRVLDELLDWKFAADNLAGLREQATTSRKAG